MRNLSNSLQGEPFWNQVSQMRERLILEAARTQLAIVGCVGWGLEDIAKTVGVGRTTIYRHFSNRDSMIRAVLAAVSTELLDIAIGKSQDSGIGREQTLQYLRLLLFPGLQSPSSPSIRFPCCFKINPCPYEGYADVVRILESSLERGQQDGTIDARLNRSLTIEAILGFLARYFTSERARTDPEAVIYQVTKILWPQGLPQEGRG